MTLTRLHVFPVGGYMEVLNGSVRGVVMYHMLMQSLRINSLHVILDKA